MIPPAAMLWLRLHAAPLIALLFIWLDDWMTGKLVLAVVAAAAGADELLLIMQHEDEGKVDEAADDEDAAATGRHTEDAPLTCGVDAGDATSMDTMPLPMSTGEVAAAEASDEDDGEKSGLVGVEPKDGEDKTARGATPTPPPLD